MSRARHVGRDGRGQYFKRRLSLPGRPHRLAAQVTALSRLQRGFESRWGHVVVIYTTFYPAYRSFLGDRSLERASPNARDSLSLHIGGFWMPGRPCHPG